MDDLNFKMSSLGLTGKFSTDRLYDKDGLMLRYQHVSGGFVYTEQISNFPHNDIYMKFMEFALKLAKELVPQNRPMKLEGITEQCVHCAAPRLIGIGCNYCGAGK